MSKGFTKGPWRVDVRSGNLGGLAIFAADDFIADIEIPIRLKGRESAEANAHLIAAAPLQHELLIALSQSSSDVAPLRIWAEKYGIDLGNSTNSRVVDVAINAAIRASEGKSHV